MMRRLWRSPKRNRPMELGWSQPSPRARLGEPVNRKRAQRIMRTHRLLQPTRGLGRRRRLGYFPGETAGRVVAYGHDQSLDSPARLGLPPRHRGLLHPRTRRMESRRVGPNRRGAGLCRHGDDPTVRGPGSVDDRDGQRNAVHLPTLPQPTRRTWDRPSERRIPRSRVSGVHRVMVRGGSRSVSPGAPSGKRSIKQGETSPTM